MPTYDSDMFVEILFILTKFSPHNVVERCIFELTSGDGQAYTVDLNDTEEGNPDVLIILIKHGRNNCFQITVL